MLKSSKAKKEYKEKIKQYKRYSKKYFEDSAPIISDQDFDLLKKEILDLEKRFDFKDKDSPSKTLGFTPSKNFEKYPHRVKMLSLANAFNEEDLINFEKIQIFKFKPKLSLNTVLSLKSMVYLHVLHIIQAN